MTEREFYNHLAQRYSHADYDCPSTRYNNGKGNMSMLGEITINVGDKTYYPLTYDITNPFDEPTKLELTTYLCYPYRYPAKPKLSITNVIFNPPATIVYWSDHTKTVVKCDTSLEKYDPEKGLAMAISRKLLGDNKREYYNTFLHWLKRYDKQPEEETTTVTVEVDGREFSKVVTEAINEPRKRRNRIPSGTNT